jgi:MinD-like ATPase involved in chromosome partitioning or flagellar assembly
VERTDSDWGQGAEPVPRWRMLLDRSRLHGRLLEEREQRQPTERAPEPQRPPGQPEWPYPPAGRDQGEGAYPPPSGRDHDERAYPPPRPERGHPQPERGPGERTYGQPERGHPQPDRPYGQPERLHDRYPERAADRYPAERYPPADAFADPRSLRQPPPQQQPQPPPPAQRGEPPKRYAQPVHYLEPPTTHFGATGLPAADPRLHPPPADPRTHAAPPAADPRLHPPPADPRVHAAPPAVDPRFNPPAADPRLNPPAVDPRAQVPPAPRAQAYPVAQRRPVDAEAADRLTARMRRDLGTPRVLAFTNPKGGVHKTTATVLTAATIGVARGQGVIAWDDNELRGTLGLRAGSARHARTIRHLVRDLLAVEAASGPELTERLDQYLRHASDGSYDVLAGEESPRFAQRLDPHTVKRVLDLLRRTHDVICVDTGNNVESPNWQTVVQGVDQLVVTTVPREDAAFAADWMLDLLEEMDMGEMVSSAVTLISCPTPNPSPLLKDLTAHFATRTRAVAVVPYDPALETGASIDHTALQPATRLAWMEAAATMLDGFAADTPHRLR